MKEFINQILVFHNSLHVLEIASKANKLNEFCVIIHDCVGLENYLEVCKRKYLYNPYSGNRELNHFPHKPLFLRVCSISLLKTRREKEKLLVMSNFSFSHGVFYPFWRTVCHFHSIQSCLLKKSFNLEESKIRRFGKG